MALTSEQLYAAASLQPAHFGEEIVSPNLATDEEKRQAVLTYITNNVLPAADGQVSLPLWQLTGHYTVESLVEAAMATKSAEERAVAILKGQSLYDGAAKSFGRSELNKVTNSDSAGYDRDSDQDRLQGKDQLASLLAWATKTMDIGSDDSSDADSGIITRPQTFAATNVYTF